MAAAVVLLLLQRVEEVFHLAWPASRAEPVSARIVPTASSVLRHRLNVGADGARCRALLLDRRGDAGGNLFHPADRVISPALAFSSSVAEATEPRSPQLWAAPRSVNPAWRSAAPAVCPIGSAGCCIPAEALSSVASTPTTERLKSVM